MFGPITLIKHFLVPRTSLPSVSLTTTTRVEKERERDTYTMRVTHTEPKGEILRSFKRDRETQGSKRRTCRSRGGRREKEHEKEEEEEGKKKTDIIRIPSKRSIDNPPASTCNDSLVNAVSKGDEMRVELSRCEHRQSFHACM